MAGLKGQRHSEKSMQRILCGADCSSSSLQDVAAVLVKLCNSAFVPDQQRCASAYKTFTLDYSSRARCAQPESSHQTPCIFANVPSAQLLHLSSSLSPQELRLQSTYSKTDCEAVCLELQSVCAPGKTCGCSDRLLNCVKQSQRGAPESTLTAVKNRGCVYDVRHFNLDRSDSTASVGKSGVYPSR